MTAVNWLLEELKKVHHPTEAMIMYANKMFEKQIIDAVNIDKRQYDNAQQYYNETYGSKGSGKTLELPKQEMIDQFIDFQIYIHTEGLITNHDWDFENIAKKYIESLKHPKKD